MKITVDEILLTLNLEKGSEFLKDWWSRHKSEMDILTTSEGTQIDIGPKSVKGIALRTLMTPLVPPALRMLYATKGATPRPKVKHEDVLDYFVDQLISFLAVLDKDAIYVETLEGHGSYSRTINAISTHVPNYITAVAIREATEENTSLDTRGETLVRSREDRNGEDEVSEGDNTEET